MNLFYDLPNELIMKIYEYDPTHHQKYSVIVRNLPIFMYRSEFPIYQSVNLYTFFFLYGGCIYSFVSLTKISAFLNANRFLSR